MKSRIEFYAFWDLFGRLPGKIGLEFGQYYRCPEFSVEFAGFLLIFM
jgi:hypothetical protein